MNSNNRFDVVIIGGFGHVGLPLGIVLADAGFQVALYDIDQSKRATIEAGKMPFFEHDAEPILRQVIGNTLHIAASLPDVEHSELVFITIGTPVDEYLNPKTRPILELSEQLTRYLRPEHCVIIRSTVYPGTCKCLDEFFKQRGRKVHIAYCPERIVQGYAVRELLKLPQIISGFTDTAVQCAEALFKRLGVETIQVTVQEAELAKLFSNAWRYIQFAITNQFYMIATEQGSDYVSIYQAMTYNYERTKDFPQPGFAAGPCLLKDTMQLAAFYGNHFQLGHAAMLVNEGLPNFIVNQLKNDLKLDLTDTRVGILGMAFKADTDDIRESLSYKLAKILRFHGASVVCSDEYVRDRTFVTKEDLVAKCPIVIVGVPHSSYKELVVPDDIHLVDLWGVFPSRIKDGKHDPGQFLQIYRDKFIHSK
ncbi:nucleotide sugar dehydrogenase [Desulfobacterota bacterium AH_259_B03_O07]|nr:nucleotide sugar dehydrogenase [Desulfobacterota bacterium AH_259_B03_O07]